MTELIAIANQKGGVGKTTTATALCAALELRGRRTLLVDTDPQGNASDTYCAQIDGTATLYDVLVDGIDAEEAIQRTPAGDILPGDPLLAQAELLLNRTGKEYALKKALASIGDRYDYILIDCPPAMGVLLTNALTCAGSVIVPITADRYGLQGLSQLQETIRAVQEYTNPALKVAGLLLTKYTSRTRLGREVAACLPGVAEQMGTRILPVSIRESVAAKEAQARRVGLFDHAPACTTALDYAALAHALAFERRG